MLAAARLLGISVWQSPGFMTWGAWGARALSLVTLLPLTLALLPAEEVAAWFLFFSVQTLVSLVDFGFAPTFVRAVAYGRGSLAPFGQENRAPLLVARGVLVQKSRKVGDGSHLKLELEAGGPVRGAIGAIGFGLAAEDPGEGARVVLAFSPAVSSWQGRRRVELVPPAGKSFAALHYWAFSAPGREATR